MKFRWKLMLSFMLLVITMAALFYILFDRTLHGYATSETAAQLQRQTALAKVMIEHENSKNISESAKIIATAIKARVTIISPVGLVIGDSEVTESELSTLDNHADRPEIIEAAKSGSGTSIRYSSTIHKNMLYSAIPFKNSDKSGFVRLALPLDSLSKIRSTLHKMIGGSILFAVLASLLLSYFLSRIVFKPLEAISAAAIRIGKGELDLQIPISGNDEVSGLAKVMNEMSVKICEQLQKIAAEKQQQNAIFQAMGEGVMVVDNSGIVTLLNPAFCKIFALDDASSGRALIEVSRNPELLSAYHQQQETSAELVREIVIPAKGQTLLTHWVPLDLNEERLGVVAVFHDISDLKKTEIMRRDFVANVSHELRTPLTVIKGYAETMLDGVLQSDPKMSRQFTEIILRHSERLTTLISDILTLSNLEAKAATIELSATDFLATLNYAVLLLSEQAATKNIKINIEISDNLPKVLADKGKLEQVLLNLLENGIKYTPAGGIICIYAKESGEFIKISIADSGIGISEKDIARIFERFYRVDEARSREQGGTGLGLAIVKHIILLHGGEVSVTSEIGKGSTFKFTLLKK